MGRKERRAKERQERKESIRMTPDRIYELKQKTANEAVRRVQEIEKGKEKQRAETALDMPMDAHREKKKEKEETEEKQLICALTDENCIFVAERGTCTGCPIAEEAEKRGYR